MSERRKHKDWFDRDCAVRLGEAVRANHAAFDVEGYADEIEHGVPALELKGRVALMARGLRERLPDDYAKAAAILQASLGPPLEGETGMFTQGYWLMPVARFVEEYGLTDWSTSMDLNEAVTQRHTAEFAVRPFVEADPERTLERMREWTGSNSAHVRRLASEGARPRLPWGKRLIMFIEDPEPILALAEPLKADPSAYVRKSVANLINDVSKDHPDRIRELTERWSRDSDAPETAWIVRHGTRTLRKSAP